VQALKQCVTTQTVAYEFPYSSFTFNTDLNFLVLTQGNKSPFVDVDVDIPLQSVVPSPTFALHKSLDALTPPSPEKLDQFRKLIGGAKTGNVTVGKDVSEYIQSDFVRERQQAKGINSEDLVIRMSAARLMTLSLHETEMTKDIWERTKTLDVKRKARLAAR